MKFHKIEMVGRLLLQKITDLPIFSSEDESRVLYNTTNKSIYYADNTRYKKLSGKINEFTTPATSGDLLEVGYSYPIDTSTGEVILLLPTDIYKEDMIELFDSEGSFADNSLVVDGNGNTINGNDTVSFSVDDSFIRLIFDGEEWKADIGGLNTVVDDTGINFASMGSATEINPNDNLIYQDATDGNTKKITSNNFLQTLDVSNLTSMTSPKSDDYLLIHDVSENINKKFLSSSLSTSSKNIYPYQMNLDFNDEYSSFGSIFNSIKTVDFDIYGKGSVWFSFNFPAGWGVNRNIDIIVSYSTVSNDPDKTVNLQVSYWCVKNGDAPDSNSPDITYSNTLNITSDKINKYNRESLSSIESSYITSDSSLALIKVTRDPSLDNYAGKLKVANFIFNIS